MKKFRAVAIFLSLSLLIAIASTARAGEPDRPVVNGNFPPKTEAAISALANIPVDDAFRRLKGINYLSDEARMNKAVFTAFAHRDKEAIDRAASSLQEPLFQVVNGKSVNRSTDFYVARKIFEVFPDDAVKELLELYARGDSITRGNIIRASGKMASQEIRDLLLAALDDKTFIEQTYPEQSGEPMRICDVAYNQLVLRYQIRNVLLTLNPVYRIAVRDYHINVLKRMFGR